VECYKSPTFPQVNARKNERQHTCYVGKSMSLGLVVVMQVCKLGSFLIVYLRLEFISLLLFWKDFNHTRAAGKRFTTERSERKRNYVRTSTSRM